MTQTTKKAALTASLQRRKARAAMNGPVSLASLMDERGALKIDEVAKAFVMSRAQLAETAGLAREVLQKTSRRDGPKAQTRVREMIEIISLVQGWAGGPA